MRRDVKAFFGSYAKACERADRFDRSYFRSPLERCSPTSQASAGHMLCAGGADPLWRAIGDPHAYDREAGRKASLLLKRPRRNVSAANRERQPEASGPNEMWSMDFVSDALFDGWRLRALTVVDAFSFSGVLQ